MSWREEAAKILDQERRKLTTAERIEENRQIREWNKNFGIRVLWDARYCGMTVTLPPNNGGEKGL